MAKPLTGSGVRHYWRGGLDNTSHTRHSLNCQSQLLALYVYTSGRNEILPQPTRAHTHTSFSIFPTIASDGEKIYILYYVYIYTHIVNICMYMSVNVCVRAFACSVRASVSVEETQWIQFWTIQWLKMGIKFIFFSQQSNLSPICIFLILLLLWLLLLFNDILLEPLGACPLPVTVIHIIERKRNVWSIRNLKQMP